MAQGRHKKIPIAHWPAHPAEMARFMFSGETATQKIRCRAIMTSGNQHLASFIDPCAKYMLWHTNKSELLSDNCHI